MNKFFSSKKISTENGFTLIELLVATSLFAIVAIGAISILLSSQMAYKRLSGNRVAIDNMNLVLDSMSREIKYGSKYGCINSSGSFVSNTYYQSFSSSIVFGDSIGNDCNALVFTPQGATSTKIVYHLDMDKASLIESHYDLSGSDYVHKEDFQITSPDLDVSSFWFKIIGTANNDYLQPSVSIHVSSIITLTTNSQNAATTTAIFSGQTVASQRILDN